MNWKNTWLLIVFTGALFSFIYFFERHQPTSEPRAVEGARVLPELSTADILRIQLRRGNDFSLVIERTNRAWFIMAPHVYPASTLPVNGLLLALRNLTAPVHITSSEVLQRRLTSADFGFDAPQAVLTLYTAQDRQEMQVGADVAAGNGVYVQVMGRPGIYVVDRQLLDLFPATREAWRSTSLFENAQRAFDRVEVAQSGGSSWVLQNPGAPGGWRLARPSHRADQVKVGQLLERLKAAQVVQFLNDDPKGDLERLGLQTPELEVALGEGTNQMERVQFGASPTNDPQLVYARRLEPPALVLVPKSIVQYLNTPYTTWRDRHVVSFQPSAVTEIQVQSAEPFTVRRQTNGQWLVNQELRADPYFMEDWLEGLSQMQVSDFVKDIETDFTRFGLAPPDRRYVLLSSLTNHGVLTNTVIAQLDFSTNRNESVYAHRADEDSVYAVPLKDYHFMPAAAWQLRDHRVWSFTTNQVIRVIIRQGGETRQLLRNSGGDWTFAPGSQGIINSWAVEETIYRLGELTAVKWVERGDLPRESYGIAETDHALDIEIRAGETLKMLTLEFGGTSPVKLPYAAVRNDGQRWVFEFPWPLYLNVQRDLSIPRTRRAEPPAPAAAANP